MAKNKQVYTLQIDAELGNLQSKLTSVKSLLAGVLGSENAPKGLDKTLVKIEGLIDRVRAKASQPIDSKAGFSSISKDVSGAQIALAELLKVIQSIHSLPDADKLSFLPPDAQAQISKIISSLSDYASAIEAATTETVELTAARDKLAQAEEKVAAAQAKVASKQGNLDAAKRDKESAEKAIAAIEERKKKLEELKEEQKSIEEFYKGNDEAGNKRNRSKKYEGVRMRPQDISKQISKLESSGAGDAESLTTLRAQLKAAKSDISSYTGQITTANRVLREAEQEQKKLTEAVATLSDKFEQSKPQQLQSAYESLKKEAEELGVSLEGIGEGYSDQDSAELIRRLTDLKKKGFDQLTTSTQKAEENIEDFGDKCKGIKDEVNAGAEALENMNEAASQQEAFENKIKQFLGLSGAAQVLRASLRDAMQTIQELDATMTEMAVVTDLTVGDYWGQLPDHTKRASELGVAINDVYKAETLYYQQGLKTNQVVAMSTETLKMARIAGLSAEDATNKMTAALRGFNMELNETSTQRVSDVYSELAAITAADTEEISNAMTKTASIANSANMEFETTAAFLSQIIETTRESAETAGTAMKTIIARFQELKKDPAEIGEVDGEIVDANKIEGALRSVGVSLRDASGQFRALDEVFLELASKWDTLDTNTQRYIATIAAGSRQQSRFLAMMSDYSRTQELVVAANNSAGASQRQYEKTLDSLESKLNQLKNAWHEFTMGILNSDFVKVGVDILTKFLEVVNSVTSAFDGVLGSVTKIGSVLAIFKLGKTIFEKFKPSISNFLVSVIDEYKKAGVESGSGFAQGVGQGVQKQKNVSSVGVQDGETGNKKFQKAPGSIGRVQDGGFKGFVANAGIGIMESVGVGYFADASSAHQKKKEAQNKLIKAQGILGTDEATKDLRKKNYEKQKSVLDKYTVHANGTVYEKGKKGLLSGNEAEKAKAEIEGAKKEVEEYESAIKDAEKAGGEIENASKTQWSSISKGLQAVSGAAAGVALGFGMIGQVFTDAGFEEIGEVISGIGSAFMVLSVVMSVVSSMLPLLQMGFGAAGTAGVTSGLASTAAWGVFGLIVMAVMAAILLTIAVILLVVKAIENMSPEKKLEDAETAAANAAEAADSAAEAFDKLAESLNNLDGKYKAIEELVRGTKEWNEAVRDINNSVLDLIDEYPELASLVENKEGVLTIDVESDEVQEVLDQAEARKILTKNQSVVMDLAVSQAQNNVKFGELEAIEQISTKRGWEAFGASVAAGGAIAKATGPAARGTLTAGLTTGAIVGAIAGPLTAAATANDEKLQNAVGGLAEAIQSGEDGMDGSYDKMLEYLTSDEVGLRESEAEIIANEFDNNLEELISYGESVSAIKKQQEAAYDAIAASAHSLANTLSMTKDQIQQSSVLVDGDYAGELYEEKMQELADEDLKDLEDNYEVQAAVQETYGKGAKIDKDGTVTYVKDGVNAEVTLTADQIKAMVATQYATEGAARAIENSASAISAVGEAVGKQVSDSAAGQAAVNALYMQNEGRALTQADLEILQKGVINYEAIWESLSEGEQAAYGNDIANLIEDFSDLEILQKGVINYEAIWESLGEGEQAAYGNDIANLIEDFSDAINFASEAFGKAGDAARDFMTADMATAFKIKLDEVAELAGGEEARKAVQDKTDTLLAGKNADIQREIQNRINATDWSNTEELLALQLELELQYGYLTDDAKEYVDALGDAAFATSGLDTTVRTYGELWKATEKINQSMTRLNKLQWQYNRAISGQGDIVEGLLGNILKEYKIQAEQYEKAYHDSNEDIARIYAQGGTQYGVDLRQAVTLGEEGIDIDKTRIDEFIAAGQISQKDADEWINKLTEQYKTSETQLEGLRGVLENIEELEQQGQDAYYQLRDMVKEAVVASLQEQIDLQQQTLDANREANSQLINKIQEQINSDRQLKENQETEQNIADLRSQHAYISMDTSGANSLELQNLDKSIADAEQNYQDTLVDQAIQNLQDANAKAEEQRERQISLAESQLDVYQQSNQFQADIDSQLEDLLAGGIDWQSSNIGQLLTEHFTEGMGTSESDGWAKEIGGAVGAASDWLNTKWGQETQNINNYLEAIADEQGAKVENLVGEAVSRKVNAQYSTLTSSGFSGLLQQSGFTTTTDASGKTTITQTKNGQEVALDEGLLDHLSNVQKMDSDSDKIDELTTTITDKKKIAKDYGETAQASKFDILTKEEFYKTYNASSETFSGNEDGKYTSYTDYLTKKSNQVLTGIENLTAKEAFGAVAVPGSYSGIGDDWEKGEWGDVVVDNIKNTHIKLGSKVGESTAKHLDYVWGQTGGSDDKPFVFAQAGNRVSATSRWGLYLRQNTGNWWPIIAQNLEKDKHLKEMNALMNQGQKYLDAQSEKKYKKYKFATGGLADFTGPAWLDGTKSHPEYVLNADQTERFFSLVDVLEGYDKDKKPEKSGDNYFEIEINVEKLENDYDVEQVANKIRQMIYEDAMYRNVNAVSNIR